MFDIIRVDSPAGNYFVGISTQLFEIKIMQDTFIVLTKII